MVQWLITLDQNRVAVLLGLTSVLHKIFLAAAKTPDQCFKNLRPQIIEDFIVSQKKTRKSFCTPLEKLSLKPTKELCLWHKNHLGGENVKEKCATIVIIGKSGMFEPLGNHYWTNRLQIWYHGAMWK